MVEGGERGCQPTASESVDDGGGIGGCRDK